METNAEQWHYAGFWIRALATVVDTVVLLAVIVPLLLLAYGPSYFEAAALQAESPLTPWQQVVRPQPPRPLEIWIECVLPAIAVIILWRYRSATPGKMIVSARVVDAITGERPSYAQCFVRFFAYNVSALPLGLGFLWIAIDPRKQAWHDKMARTVVVIGKK